MTRPVILDLFCGVGGASRGYQKAGFETVGLDVVKQKNYCGDVFIHGGAIRFLEFLITPEGRSDLADYSAIHASPPCQRWTLYNISKETRKAHPNLIPQVRNLLNLTGKPWIIENLEQAPLKLSTLLCGSMMEPHLDVKRHRLFESNLRPSVFRHPSRCRHELWEPRFPNSKGKLARTVEIGNHLIPFERQKTAVGADWAMTQAEFSQIIPPAYTKYLGEVLKNHL